MKKYFYLVVVLVFSQSVCAQTIANFHNFWGITIHGDTLHFDAFDGKKVLVVNTASYCGYTPQFADLALLDSLYGGPEFAIIGFPCNDFGSQDPYSDSAINQFCTGNYHVKFQMMSKIAVVSADTAEVYKWLQRKDLNGTADVHVDWNFNKFLVDKRGRWVRHYSSTTNPMDTAITNWIQEPDPVGVQPLDHIPAVKVYPNPAHNSIFVSADGVKISNLVLTDLLGQELVQATDGTLDISGLAAGVYMLHICSANGERYQQKVLKQ